MSEATATTSTPANDAGEAQPTDSSAVNTQGTATTATEPATDASTQATETKTDEVQVPETYELKMPEGVELDKAAADEFTAIAKELKLDQATAQKLADVAAAQALRRVEQHVQQVTAWAEQVKADKEIGGDKFDENLGVARKALSTFGSPELAKLLDDSGFGNHPEIVKAFYKVGKAISEDRFVGGAAKGNDTDPAKKLFPNMN